jgi:hypothetical protein
MAFKVIFQRLQNFRLEAGHPRPNSQRALCGNDRPGVGVRQIITLNPPFEAVDALASVTVIITPFLIQLAEASGVG